VPQALIDAAFSWRARQLPPLKDIRSPRSQCL
jgi:hypothetical protein